MCTLLTSRIQASHSFPVIPTGAPTSLPTVQPHGGGARHMVHTAHSQGRISISVVSLSSEAPWRGPGPHPLSFLPILPDYVGIFLTALVVQEPFC